MPVGLKDSINFQTGKQEDLTRWGGVLKGISGVNHKNVSASMGP